MNRLLFLALSLISVSSHAQGFGGFGSESTCYSWNGGNLSSGSFIKCTPTVVETSKPTTPVVAPVVQQAPTPPPPPVADKKING